MVVLGFIVIIGWLVVRNRCVEMLVFVLMLVISVLGDMLMFWCS